MTIPTTTVVPSKLDTIKAEIMTTYAAQFKEASELSAKGDVAGMVAAITRINAEIETKASERIKVDKAALDKLAESEAKGKVALETHVNDLFDGVFQQIKEPFQKLTTVGQVICRVEKDTNGVASFTVLVGNLTKVGSNGSGSGRSGPRVHTIIIDGTTYGTVKQGWDAVMPGVPQPTKSVGTGTAARLTATRDVAVIALKAAGKVVTE